MSERLKKTSVWHKVFGVVETVALVACATGERIGLVTPPPEGTATKPTETVLPPSTETIPTSPAETVTGASVEFLEQDAVLATKLTETQTLANLYTVEPIVTPTAEEATVAAESFIRSLEKDGIIFPDKLSSESESDFLRGIYLSESVMEKTGVEGLSISPEKLDNVGKAFLGILAWTQRNSRPEYQFLQSVQTD